jgi:hypothetical protein
MQFFDLSWRLITICVLYHLLNFFAFVKSRVDSMDQAFVGLHLEKIQSV